ncbi:polyhydroxyalkanoic acid synthase subunit PhaR [Neobacillus drentensis]|uniref:polyhydroxyalkanoic acid synthase subunit PhaR n=1 Tax=Neobacillus drentensis TaxID=220684 RepID=UPI002FFE1111
MGQTYNFFDIWKDYFNQSSNFWDEKVNEKFPSQEVGKMLDMNLQFKKMINESTEKNLEFMNLPTRNDLANISSLIVNVDAKVDDLEEFVQDTLANQIDSEEFKQELANLKKDVKSLESKLNQIIALLKSPKDSKTTVNG